MCFTEMISANGLIRESAKTIEYLKTSQEDQPLGVQLFGADPGIFARAAVIVSDYHPAVIDLNMGCPVKSHQGRGRCCVNERPRPCWKDY